MPTIEPRLVLMTLPFWTVFPEVESWGSLRDTLPLNSTWDKEESLTKSRISPPCNKSSQFSEPRRICTWGKDVRCNAATILKFFHWKIANLKKKSEDPTKIAISRVASRRAQNQRSSKPRETPNMPTIDSGIKTRSEDLKIAPSKTQNKQEKWSRPTESSSAHQQKNDWQIHELPMCPLHSASKWSPFLQN